MAIPTTMNEAFVYCWTDHLTEKLYVGYHKGSVDDGYVSSSKKFLKEYNKRPGDFTRQIIAHGTVEDMQNFEIKILTSAKAAQNKNFYNRHNGGKNFYCNGHTAETRSKMSKTWKNKGSYNCDPQKARAAWIGQKHSEKAKALIGEKSRQFNEKRRKLMAENNPMKNPESITKMLATRRKNKELKNGNSY